MGFKSAAWVFDRWLGFANLWLGWWVWWLLLAPTGLMVCVCVALCVELVLEVEGEREEKKYCWKAQENRIMPKSEKK